MSYRARRPAAWYAALLLIVVAGVSLVVYSRNERLNATVVAPTASDNWQTALSVDLCGVLQPDLPPSSNVATVGIRTFGGGVINTAPGAAGASAAAYEGANATLGKFASSYPGFTLSDTSLRLPGKGAKTYANGDHCGAAGGSRAGKGTLVAKVWSSPTATPQLVTTGITGIRLTNGEMITLAFVPAGAPIPVPSSKGALLQALGGTNASSSTTTTVPASSSTTTTVPASSSTTTTVPASSGSASSSTTTTPGSSGAG